MIVKYLSDDVWGYIDHVRQIATRDYDGHRMITTFDSEVLNHKRIVSLDNSECYMNGVELTPTVKKSNKIFTMVTELLNDMTSELNARSVNLIRIDADFTERMPVNAVLLYLEPMIGAEKDYDAMVLITNQKCYLMNDEGKTIERLS